MCETCGCGQTEDTGIHTHLDEHGNPYQHFHAHGEHEHEHGDPGHKHGHDHSPGEDAAHSHGHPAGPGLKSGRVINVNRDILSENNRLAERNRGFFAGRGVYCFNMVSSPGSGKTTILEKTIGLLSGMKKIYVIEGDQQTSRDAERIEKSGAPAVQVNTGTGCHLDAHMVNSALQKLNPERNSLLFIENVGNLVCPALFDLGESKRVVVISVTEGDDKPLKYPYMFASSRLCIINKTDLLPYVDFSMEVFMDNARKASPKIEFIALSAKTGEGMDEWLKILQ